MVYQLAMSSVIKSYHTDIFLFDDLIEYLNKLLSENKNRYRITFLDFAKSSGIGSAALLSLVLNRKRKLSYQAAEKIIQITGLRGEKKKYFLLLHKLHHSKTERERAEAREEILKLKLRPNHNKLKLEQYRILSTWYYPVLYILAGLPSTRWDMHWLSERLGEQVSPQQVKEALEDLANLGLLKKEGEVYVRGIENPTTEEDFKDLAVFRYHEQMIQLALRALNRPIEQREFNGLTTAIPKSEVKRVKEKIRMFRRELNDYLNLVESSSEDVYQINIQLFQLTTSLSVEETKNETVN